MAGCSNWQLLNDHMVFQNIAGRFFQLNRTSHFMLLAIHVIEELMKKHSTVYLDSAHWESNPDPCDSHNLVLFVGGYASPGAITRFSASIHSCGRQMPYHFIRVLKFSFLLQRNTKREEAVTGGLGRGPKQYRTRVMGILL